MTRTKKDENDRPKRPLPAGSDLARMVERGGTVLLQDFQDLEMYVERTMDRKRDIVKRVSVYGMNLNTHVEVFRVIAELDVPAWIGWTPGFDWFREEIEQHGIAIADGVFFLDDLDEFVDALERTIPENINEIVYEAELGNAVEIDCKTKLPKLPPGDVRCEAVC